MSDALTLAGLCDETRARSPLLTRVAEALGRPVEAIIAPPARDPLAGAVELLALWTAIPDADDRERILACARSVAAGRSRAAW